MSHLTDEIAALEAELTRLKAIQAAEDAEAARALQNRPAGLPPDWLPFLFKVDGTFETAAWYSPKYTISVLRIVTTSTLALPTGKP